jgi:hypothetical protein
VGRSQQRSPLQDLGRVIERSGWSPRHSAARVPRLTHGGATQPLPPLVIAHEVAFLEEGYAPVRAPVATSKSTIWREDQHNISGDESPIQGQQGVGTRCDEEHITECGLAILEIGR